MSIDYLIGYRSAGIQRLKSRLERHEVRLRGLRIEPAQAGLAPFQPRFQPLVPAARPIPD